MYSGFSMGYLFNVLQNSQMINWDDQFTIDGDPNSEGINNIKTRNVTEYFNTMDYQWKLGCSIKLNTSWWLNIEHGLSLRNIQKNNSVNSYYPQTISLGVSKNIL